MQLLKAGALYFALVFGAGFILGIPRTLWLIPRVGTRMAELLEMPVMLAVIVLSARWIVARFAVSPALSRRLAVGAVALALVLTAELTLVLGLRGLSVREYLATRDPVSGTAYYLMLVLFAIAPTLVARK